MTGSWGWLRPNHAGGTHTYACRGVNFRLVPGMETLRVAPWSGSWPVLSTCVRMAVSCALSRKWLAFLPNRRSKVG